MYGLMKMLTGLDQMTDSLWEDAFPNFGGSSLSPFYEKEGKLLATVDLPGVKKDNLEVHLDRQTLTIRATRNDGIKSSTYHRTFLVPTIANLETLDASLADGVLTLTFAMKEKPKALAPKKIEVR